MGYVKPRHVDTDPKYIPTYTYPYPEMPDNPTAETMQTAPIDSEFSEGLIPSVEHYDARVYATRHVTDSCN
jgi:hypothetical protein